MTNIYDKANELEKVLREDENFKSLEKAFKDLAEKEESKNIYDNFLKKQQEYMVLLQSGKKPSDEEIKNLQELQKQVFEDKTVSNLIQIQQRLQVTLEDINKIIFKPIGELFNNFK